MTKEDIIKLTQEAGLYLATDVHWMPIIGLEYAEKFAALVAIHAAAKEREWMQDINKRLIAEAVAVEREACAKVCEELDAWNEDDPGSSAAAAIRARGQE